MLKDKICIVTGALGGLGSTVTRLLDHAGAVVIGVDHSDVPADYAFEYHKVDLIDEREVSSLFAGIMAAHKRVDGLVNLVGGIYPWSAVEDVEWTVWEKTVALNLTPTFLCSRAAIGPMKKQQSGVIINIGSQAGLKGARSAGPYGAAKAAVLNLTQTIADEGKAYGLRAHVVIPSTIDTPANRKSMPDADFSRWVSPEEIANVIVFLLSDSAGGVNGAIIPVPGRL